MDVFGFSPNVSITSVTEILWVCKNGTLYDGRFYSFFKELLLEVCFALRSVSLTERVELGWSRAISFSVLDINSYIR